MKGHKQKPNWRLISDLPLIAHLIDEGLSDSEEQYKTFLEVRQKPHVLDDAIIDRAIRFYNEESELIETYDEQLSRWRKGKLTESQCKEAERLSCQNEQFRELNKKIRPLLQELKKGTINRTMEMSDLELGLKFLSGEIK